MITGHSVLCLCTVDKFVPFKTPLDNKYDEDVPEECRFGVDMLMESLKVHKVIYPRFLHVQFILPEYVYKFEPFKCSLFCIIKVCHVSDKWSFYCYFCCLESSIMNWFYQSCFRLSLCNSVIYMNVDLEILDVTIIIL